MTCETVTMSSGETQDGATTASIRWQIDDVSGMEDSVHLYSPKIELYGIPWQISVAKEDWDGSLYLAAYLYGLENDSVMWSVDVKSIFTVINKDNSRNVVDHCFNKFNHKIGDWGLDKLIEWSLLMDETKGFITDDKVTIECQFTLSNVIGLSTNPQYDFTNAKEPRHDATLLVGGKKLYASKQILAVHSPVFNAMFYGNFAEKDKNEIELKDVVYEDFIEMLNMIYPTGKMITDDNAVRLLSVGNRYLIKTIVDQAEQFLITSTKLSVAAKLKLSDEYRLVRLQGSCLNSLMTISAITDLNGTEEYNYLSETTKVSLLEKIMKLAESTKHA